MAGDAFVPLVGDLDGGRHLDLAHRGDLGPRVGHELVARDVDLDVIDALAATEANRAPDLVRPVGDHAEAFGVHVLLALVAEAAGHRDFRPRGAITRSGEIAVLDFLTHDDVHPQLGGRRRIAGGEAVIEDQRRVAAGSQQVLFGRNFAEILVAHRTGEGEMAMAFDHARHQRHACRRRSPRRRRGEFVLAARDRGDAVTFDQHLGRIALVVFAVPDLRVLNQKGHRVHPPL